MGDLSHGYIYMVGGQVGERPHGSRDLRRYRFTLLYNSADRSFAEPRLFRKGPIVANWANLLTRSRMFHLGLPVLSAGLIKRGTGSCNGLCYFRSRPKQ